MTKGVVLVALVLVSTSTAHAQRVEADAAFERGRQLMQAGKYEEACNAFDTSLRLDPSIGTLYNLGLCHEKLGKLASAYTELRQVAEKDTNKARASDAAKRADKLEPRLTRFKLVVKEPTAGLVVERDGIDITAFVDQVVPVDPRRYTFTATAPGLEPYSTSVELTEEGTTVDVTIPALAPKKDGPVVPVTPGVPADPYPRVLPLRPFTMPDGMYEVGAATVGSTSDSMFEQSPIDTYVAARIGIQMFEMGLRASFHTRYAEVDATRPRIWRSVAATLAYRIAPMFVGQLEYTRYHPIGDLGKGSDLSVALLRKYLLAPRVAIAGSAGFKYTEFGERSELALVSTFGPQFAATQVLSFELVADLGLNIGGELYSHTTNLGVAAAGLYTITHDLDVFVRVFAGLLPAVAGSSSNDFRSLTIGVSWRP